MAWCVGTPLYCLGATVDTDARSQDATSARPAAGPTATIDPAAGLDVLSGSVSDPSGAKVQHASVHVQGGAVTRDVTTDSTGRFTIPLPAGMYDITIVAPGFEPYITNVTLTDKSTHVSLDAKLTIANQAQELTVPSDEAADTSAAANKSALVFKADQLKTFSDDDDTFQKQIQALAGSGDDTNGPSVYVDGFSNGKFPPKNTIREIRINQNPYSAEYSEMGYGRIEIFTKPGADKFHGQFFIGGNQSALNTSNPYVSVQPPYYSIDIFGEASGPITKKMSGFLNIQYSDSHSNAIVDATTLNTALQQVPFTQAVANPTTTADYSGRIDRQVSTNNTLIAKYDYLSLKSTNAGVGLLVLPSEGTNSTTTTQTLQIADTQVIGTTMVSEGHFQYVRTRLSQTTDSTAPTLNVEGGFNGGGSAGQINNDNQDSYEFQEIFTRQQGPKHFIRLGGRYRLLRDANLSTGNFNGQFTFPSLTAYQITEQGLAAGASDATIRATCVTTPTGQVCGGATQFSITAGQPRATVLTGDLGAFAEDEWKISNSFTLDFGIRLETQSAIPDHFDPAPRVGFAWAVGQKEKKPALFTLRSGGGIFYDRFSSTNILTSIRQNGVTESSYYVNNPSFYPAIPSTSSLSAALPTVYQISPHLRSEYAIVEGASIERSLWKKGTISLNYLSWQFDHQWDSVNLNAPLPGTYNATTSTGTYPLGTSQPLYQFQSGGTERLNRFFVRVNANPNKHMFLFAFYTVRDKKTDTNGATSFPSNSYDIHQDYGRGTNPAQRLYIGSFFDLPGGITVNSFLSASSSTPFNITTGTDLNGDSQYNDRPAFATNLTSSSIPYKTKYGYFDANPQPGEKIIPINYGNGPSYVELDFGLGKSFKFGPRDPVPAPPPDAPAPKGPAARPDPRYSLNFGMDAENIFNDVNPGPPVGILTSPQFGQSISLNSPYGGAANANRVIRFRTIFNF
jgi:hypothetical protein